MSNYCYDLEICYAHSLLFGGYEETQATLQESLENSKLIKHSVFFPYVGMRVYPNTQLSKIALGEGLISCEKDLMNPVYYISKHVDLDTIKPMALSTGGKWVFPDDESSPMMQTFRKRGRKGPLWEYLRY